MCADTLLSFHDLIDPLSPTAENWNDDGYVTAKGFIPHDLLDAYRMKWEQDNGADWPPVRPNGWESNTPYRHIPQLEAICCYQPLAELLENLIGEPAGVHLNLTGFVSTQRDWHQDGYLNPLHVGDSYAAVWVAIEDINSNSGPFQFITGSHLWGRITRERTWAHLSSSETSDPMWPKTTERFLTEVIESEIALRSAMRSIWLPSKGDVFIWHPRLIHRGSVAVEPGAHRRAVISHYSGINHRQDMPQAVHSAHGGWMFPL